MADRDLREADLVRDRGRALFVLGVAVAVHQHDRASAQARFVGLDERHLQRGLVERLQHVTVGTDPLVDLYHALVEHLWQHDVAGEDRRAILVGDAQRVAKATGYQQQRAIALALEQRVGGDGRAHLDGLDPLAIHGLVSLDTHELADCVHGGVAVALRMLGQQLAYGQRTVGSPGNDIGEGATTVNPELPACARQRRSSPVARVIR